MTAVHRAVDAVWKLESAKIVAGLVRMVHDVGLAEEMAQDALVAALEQWPESGVPDNPGAWLMAVAKRRAVDRVRRDQRLADRRHLLADEQREWQDHHGDPAAEFEGSEESWEPGGSGARGEHGTPEGDGRDGRGGGHGAGRGTSGAGGPGEPPSARDDVLRLMLLTCHPVLSTDARVALTLRLLGGLTAGETARAFLVPEAVIARRVADAKRRLATERAAFELPGGEELAGRLASVLDVIYLVFNEGYSATSGDDLLRPGLTLEALRLGRLLAELAPREPEVHGLVALMEIQESRSAARTGPDGEPVRLHEQNRGRWDPLLIRRGFAAMLRARDAGRGAPPGPYVLQAAIAVTHARAPTAEATDWPGIAALYEALERVLPTPVVRLNRAVAVGMAHGPGPGLALLDALTSDPALQDYHLLPAARGDLLARLGRTTEAHREFDRAAALTRNAAERAFLLRRAAGLAGVAPPGPFLGETAEAFLTRADLDPATLRSYGQTLRRLRRALGDGLPLAALTPDGVARVFATAWDGAAAATWNRHRSAVRAFAHWLSSEHGPPASPERDLTSGVPRRAGGGTRVAPVAALDALWGLTGPSVRERTLWRLLHESGATVTSVLALNVEDLDLADRRARGKGGWVTWRSGTAGLLPELLAGRVRGPLFLTDRRPGPGRAPAAADLDRETGRARLSYERAEYLFKQATKELDPAGEGYTLRRLRARE
ncbi:DUF6596 domain-containing protein [Streptomyces sp. JNUCC 64]